MTGTLFIVATPIGNLEDITLRALRVLREVDVIAAEDTRRTAGLLAHYGVRTATLSFHAHNERARLPALLERLRAGRSVALVSDAGTPLVSDPGAALVAAARHEGIRVEAVPGASAVLTAVVAAGLGSEAFTFLGFAPARGAARRSWFEALATERRPVVFFEAPHRIREALAALRAHVPGRTLAVARELTKLHEEILAGTADEVAARLGEPRGEFTVVVGGPAEAVEAPAEVGDEQIWRDFRSLTTTPGAGTRRQAVSALARRYGRPAREVYAALERMKRAESDEPAAQ
jgi:16S rRNA (cytidine1402-2'-O)-methyltransferase